MTDTPKPRVMRESEPIGDLMAMIGIKHAEAAEYLTAHGFKASQAAVNAWSRGTYPAPLAALKALWTLWILVNGNGILPEDAPASVRRRQASIASIRREVQS